MKVSFLVFLSIVASSTSYAAVQVTCVCSKYVLSTDDKLVLDTKELFTTSDWSKVQSCNDQTAEEITEELFNCKGVAKEDL